VSAAFIKKSSSQNFSSLKRGGPQACISTHLKGLIVNPEWQTEFTILAFKQVACQHIKHQTTVLEHADIKEQYKLSQIRILKKHMTNLLKSNKGPSGITIM